MSSPADAETADAPGPPPLPAASLPDRRFPMHICPAGTLLSRIHAMRRPPLFFGPENGSPPRGRWDAPGGEFRVCYLGEETHVTFAETFLREPGMGVVETADLARRAIASVEVRRDLKLVALHGGGLARIGATAAVCTGPYLVSRSWALALHQHASQPDGIRYRARHDDDGFAIALFDRAADALGVRGSMRLSSDAAIPELARWLDRYRMGLL